MEVGLSLGGNMGDRLRHLRCARDAISSVPGLILTAQSPVYETEPVGVKPEYKDLPYLNAVLILTSTLPPNELSNTVHEIEDKIGRERSEDRYAPRIIDIDVLYIADLTIDTPKLQIPHPSWATRRFVVQPLTDVRPNLVLPGVNRTCKEVLCSLPDLPDVVPFRETW